MKTTYWVKALGNDCEYARLLDFLATCCESFSVVINPMVLPKASRSAFDFIERAKPFVVGDGPQTRWPGGGMGVPGEVGRVVHVRVCPESVDLLKEAATDLYDWRHPLLPEDLAFYRSDKSVFFAVIGHENASFFDVDPPEKALLSAKFPNFDLRTESPF